MITLDGAGTSRVVGSFNSCMVNATAAVVLRVLTVDKGGGRVNVEDDVPNQALVDTKWDSIYKFFESRDQKVARINHEVFVGKYSGRKQARYEEAARLYRIRGFQPRKDTKVKMFIKYEKHIVGNKAKIPRAISPAGDVYLLRTGCYVRPGEERCYEIINEMYGKRVVAKGLNYDQLADLTVEAFDSYPDPVVYDLDVVKLDACISQSILKGNHRLLSSVFASREERAELFGLLRYQLNTRGSGKCSDGKYHYTVKGTLNSGQMNTSLVGITTVTSILYPLMKKFGFWLINMGDDCRIIMSKKRSKGFETAVKLAFQEFRMAITLSKPISKLEHTEFCQTVTLRLKEGNRSVRLLSDALTKDATILDNLQAKHQQAAWMVAVGKGGLATHGNLPIYDSFYKMMIREGNRYLETAKLTGRQRNRARNFRLKEGFVYWNQDKLREHKEITDECRVAFFAAFGVVPENQLLLESYYNSLEIDLCGERKVQITNILSVLLN